MFARKVVLLTNKHEKHTCFCADLPLRSIKTKLRVCEAVSNFVILFIYLLFV